MDATEGANYLQTVMDEFGLSENYCLLGADDKTIAGLERSAAVDRLRDALCLINFNGFLDDDEFLDAAPCRVYLDIDPGLPIA